MYNKKIDLNMKKRIVYLSSLIFLAFLGLIVRIIYLQVDSSSALQAKAFIQQTRARNIPAMRGIIYDRNETPLSSNLNVYTIFATPGIIEKKEKTAEILSDILEVSKDTILSKINKRVSLEKIANKVPIDKAEKVRMANLKGIVIDEDYKRIYPYGNMLSHVLGFCGGDNQGIIGIEAKYDKVLTGENGRIVTYTDAKGKKINEYGEMRTEPIKGGSLVLTIDKEIQTLAESLLDKALLNTSAKRASLIVMNPKNGEIYAMANKPDFDLNKPFEINNPDLREIWDTLDYKKQSDYLNNMWRNFSINDSYEPGSIFKIFTTTAAYEEKLFKLLERFNCSGSLVVADRRIKCWYFPRAHGSQDIAMALKNSCNPVFMELARRIGCDKFYEYAEKLGLKSKTGIDLPGEASGIFLDKKRVGPVEMAVMGFGQSFQVTPIEMVKMISIVINGGHEITPHIAKKSYNAYGKEKIYEYDTSKKIINSDTSELMKKYLKDVIENGGGKNAKVVGYSIGGKTATSEKLPRRNGKYIGSFVGFAPAEDPEVIALCLIDEPQGQYYGGVIAAPVVAELYKNVLPYLNIKKCLSSSEEIELGTKIKCSEFVGLTTSKAKQKAISEGLKFEVIGNGKKISRQIPRSGEIISFNSKIIMYTD